MFPEYIYQYVPHNEETDRLPLRHRDGHNAYLMIGAEMGVPALLLFLLLLLYMFRIMWRAYRASPDPYWKTVSVCGLCAVTSLVLTNLFGSRVISLVLAGYLWALLAILLKVPKWAEEGDPEEEVAP
jgi:O-antigen ligase